MNVFSVFCEFDDNDEGALFSSIQHPSGDISRNSSNDLRGSLGAVHVLGV